MKKLLFSAALALVAIGFNASAQDEVNNKVVNGDFEDTNYEQSVPSDWTWDPWDKQNVLTMVHWYKLACSHTLLQELLLPQHPSNHLVLKFLY